jgi:Tfp pilus assembly protein PilF
VSAHRAQGDIQSLQKLLADYLQMQPTDLAARLELAGLLVSQGKHTQAQQLYQQAPDLAKQPILLNNLADLLIAQDPKLALQYASQAYELLPQYPQIIDTYGWALTKAGKPEQGLGILRDAEIRDPDNRMIQLHLAETLRHLNRHDEALNLLQAVQSNSLQPEEQRLFTEIKASLQQK